MADPELPVLEPPAGGLAMLRARIAAADRRRSRSRAWWLAGPALACAAAIAWLVVPRAPAPPRAAAPVLADPSVGVAFYWVSPGAPAPRERSAPAFVDISAVSIAP